MSRSKSRILAIPVTLFCLALAFGYVRNNAENKLPRTGWTAGFHPYRAAGFNEVPVRVTSVGSEGIKGLTNVEIRNRWEKTATAVKIGWYVSTENGPGTILTKGESALIAIPNHAHANETVHINVPPVSLAKILWPIVQGNTLKGDFSIQVVVTQVVWEDGSTWNFSHPSNVARIQVNYSHAVPACANQSCRWHSELGAYQCEGAVGELCTNEGTSCTSSSCAPLGD
jgi:hypothetical protein